VISRIEAGEEGAGVGARSWRLRDERRREAFHRELRRGLRGVCSIES